MHNFPCLKNIFSWMRTHIQDIQDIQSQKFSYFLQPLLLPVHRQFNRIIDKVCSRTSEAYEPSSSIVVEFAGQWGKVIHYTNHKLENILTPQHVPKPFLQ